MGELNRDEKIKQIAELKKREEQYDIIHDIIQAKSIITMFLCSDCGLRIALETKEEDNTVYMYFHYDDYPGLFEEHPDYKPYEGDHYNRNICTGWGMDCNSICLDCGSYIENEETVCERCGSGNITAGNELAGKPCPVCGTALNEGITIQGLNNWTKIDSDIANEFYFKFAKRYNIKELFEQEYTKEEMIENERKKDIRDKVIFDKTFILDNPHNALRFEFRHAFDSSFYCILEWDDGTDGKLTLFTVFYGVWVDKNIECKDIDKVIGLLNKYNYFDQTLYNDYDRHGFDGYTFSLEVKYGEKYKEVSIWGITGGFLYEMGMLLINLAGKTFKELYEYAW